MSGPYDVIVAGGGTAGMGTALFAAQRGARVLVLEHAPHLGGTLHVSSGQLSAAGTRLQASRGIRDTPQLHLEDALRISRGTADARALRRVVEHAADTLHWLLDNGFEVLPGHPIVYHAHEPYSIPRTYFGPDKALGIFRAIHPLYQAQERAGRVRTLLGAEVVQALQSPDGTVEGLRFRDRAGAVGEARGRNVVLATGGYARDAARFERWTRRPLYSWCNEYSRGTGHQIGLDAGGVLRHGEKFLCTFAGVRNPQDPANVNVLTMLTPQLRQPWEVYVNLEGRRFMREDEPSVDAREHALLEQPQMSFWAIYDAGIAASAPQPLCFALTAEELAGLWNEHPSFRRHDTLAGLARLCGLDPRVLTRTAEVYNAAVASGVDAAFGRVHLPRALGAAPYYAVLHHGVSVVGWAGLDVDEQLRVLDAGGRPIPQLYAVGEVLGFGLVNGNAFIGGMGLQPALTLGRLLGQRLLAW